MSGSDIGLAPSNGVRLNRLTIARAPRRNPGRSANVFERKTRPLRRSYCPMFLYGNTHVLRIETNSSFDEGNVDPYRYTVLQRGPAKNNSDEYERYTVVWQLGICMNNISWLLQLTRIILIDRGTHWKSTLLEMRCFSEPLNALRLATPPMSARARLLSLLGEFGTVGIGMYTFYRLVSDLCLILHSARFTPLSLEVTTMP